MSDGDESRAQAQSAAFGYLRICAALGALIALVYAMWTMWTAVQLSGSAPFAWRAQLLLLEGGVPLLLALGLGCAACSLPIIRRAGWGLLIALVLFWIVWTWLVPVHPLTADYKALRLPVLVAVLDHATRRRLVEAAGHEYSAQLFAFGTYYCSSRGVDATHAQDAVQDIFAALLAEHGKTDTGDSLLQGDPSQLKAYLFKAVQLRIQTMARGENRRSINEGHAALTESDGMALSPADLYDAVELEECIAAALANCPPRAVQAYRLVHDHDFTYRETGEVMEIATQTVGAHLNLVAKRLRAAVQAWQSSVSGDVV